MRAQAVTYVIQTAVNVNMLKQTGMNIHVFYKYTFPHFLRLIAKEIRF